MMVKELIAKLQECDSDAIICVEANHDCLANVVQEYAINNTDTHMVYIADDLEYIDEVIDAKRI